MPRVVDLGVVVLQRADERVLAQRRHQLARTAAGEMLVQRDAGRAGGAGHGVVQRDAGAGVEPLPAAVLQRVEEAHRAHQVRREGLHQQPALLERLGDQREVEHLEVAQAPVDELAGAARGARGEVAGLDETDLEPAGGGVERRAAADHASPDHQDVELLGGHLPQGRRAQLRGQGDRSHGPTLRGGSRRTRAAQSTSTQSRVRCTALFQLRKSRSRSASSMAGSQRLSSAQLSVTSFSPSQKPTAMPAA